MTRPVLMLAAVLAAGLPGAAMAQYYGGHSGYGHGEWGWGYMLIGPLFMILFLAIVVALAVLAVRWLSGSRAEGGPGRSPAAHGTPALEILKQRYARGEIDREEFEERRRVLGE